MTQPGVEDQHEPPTPGATSEEPRGRVIGDPDAAPPGPGNYVARADAVFRIKRYIFAAAIIGWGLWSIYDGFWAWPAQTAEFHRLDALVAQTPQDRPEYVQLIEERDRYTQRNEVSIFLNKLLGVVLPPLGLLLLARWIYISRGEIRLDEDDRLQAPGHPPIPLEAMKRLDDELWRRKGISYVEYELPDAAGRIRLDHDWYQPGPIHLIHDRLAHVLAAGDAEPDHAPLHEDAAGGRDDDQPPR